MRIAYTCLDPGVPVFGRKGSSIHCQEVMREFQKRGFEVELFASRLGDDVPSDLAGIRTHKLKFRVGLQPADRELDLIRLNQQVGQLLDQAAPFDLVYERYALWSHAAMEFASQRGIPGILEVNSPLILEQKKYRTLINEAAAKYIRGKCFRFSTSVISVSEHVADHIRRNYFARHKTTVVPNGVNCERFQSVADIYRKPEDNKIVIGFVGTLKPWHGVSTLIKAFALAHAKQPNLVLRIVGDGPECESLKTTLKGYRSSVQRAVEWVGTIPNSLMPQMLSSFDIAVAPYPDLPDFYFSPLKILEYMAAGRPLIASHVGQICKLVRNGETGVLVTPGCARSLADAILLLTDDRYGRAKMGSSARRQAEQNYSWRRVVERILATTPNISPSYSCHV